MISRGILVRLLTVFASTFVAVGCAAVGKTVAADGEGRGPSYDAFQPFNEKADAMADVDAALAAAKADGRPVLLALGGNWCHDSRGLAAKFDEPDMAQMIGETFHLVWVDVGHRDRNLDVARRFGVKEIFGTPTILVIDSQGALMNASSVHDWRDAADRSTEETRAYLESFAAGGEG